MASTMRKFEGIYVPATVADVCLVILPACYRAMLPCRTSTSRGKRMKRGGGSSDDDETPECDVRRLKRGRHTAVAMEQECFVASSSSAAADDVVSRSEGDGQDEDVLAKKE